MKRVLLSTNCCKLWLFLKHRKALQSSKNLEASTSETFVPSIPDIQRILVEDLKDKDSTFAGSRDWIGSFEVNLI